MPLSTQEYKWVLANCWGNLTNCGQVTCHGLASRPGGVEILLAASYYRNRDKLRQLRASLSSNALFLVEKWVLYLSSCFPQVNSSFVRAFRSRHNDQKTSRTCPHYDWEIWKRRFPFENASNVFRALHRRNITGRLRKTRADKSRDYRDVIVFWKLGFQNVSRPH